jgi:hypothetical protein
MPCSPGVCAFPPGLEFCSRDGCAERPALTEEVSMGTRRSWLAVLVLLLPTSAGADDHWVDGSAAYSQAEGFSQLKGGHFAVTVPLGHIDRTAEKKKTKNWNVTADYSFHAGTHEKAMISQRSATLGMRWSIPHEYHKWNVVFVSGLVGGSWTKGSSLAGNRVAFGGGIGWEFLPRVKEDEPPIPGATPRPKKRWYELILMGYRSQAEVIFMTGGGHPSKAYVRYSTGAIVRIGER